MFPLAVIPPELTRLGEVTPPLAVMLRADDIERRRNVAGHDQLPAVPSSYGHNR
jgi:hypothetical protein